VIVTVFHGSSDLIDPPQPSERVQAGVTIIDRWLRYFAGGVGSSATHPSWSVPSNPALSTTAPRPVYLVAILGQRRRITVLRVLFDEIDFPPASQ
jgi:hypothetical protein